MVRRNDEVARLLGELAVLSELDEGSPNAFRVRAYQNAQRAVAGLETDVAELSADELAELRGIGRGIAAKIREWVETGAIAKLDELRDRHPPGKRELLEVPGLGPKKVELLHRELGVADLDGLRQALEDGRVARLPGMGERSAQKLRHALEGVWKASSKRTRVPIATALPLAERVVGELRTLPGVDEVACAGSLRRFREDIGDVDVLVAASESEPVMAAFRALPEVAEVVGSGDTKTSVSTHDGVQIDLRVVAPDSFGAALVYFTGSKAHNIRLRQRAVRRGWTLNEYALAEEGDPSKVIASRTEDEVYSALDLAWIAPELREDSGELEAAEAGNLPDLVAVEDLRGDLHDHTDLSGDGRVRLDELVAAAVERGLEYLAITDHAENLTVSGVSRDAMLAQRRELRALEQQRGDIRLLHGAELNIGPDGGLDYDPAFLAGFDWLVASVHGQFDLDVEAQTKRIVTAMREPSVTAIGHLSGRLLGRRRGIELDLERVFRAAVETGTALEINASLQRLDASAEVIREGARSGVTFVVSTDAHAADELDRARFGVALARRGWLERDRVANTLEVEAFLAWVAAIRER